MNVHIDQVFNIILIVTHLPCRILVQSGIHAEFVAAFSEAVSRLKLGVAYGEGVTQGPLINRQAINKVSNIGAHGIKNI